MLLTLDDGETCWLGHVPPNCQAPDARVEPLSPYVHDTIHRHLVQAGRLVLASPLIEVQARDSYEGIWTDWLSGTRKSRRLSPARTATPISSALEIFRGHQPAFADEEWGQAFTTVLTQPAPVLVTSRKVGMWSRIPVLSGTLALPTEVVSYTVLISNTGNLAAMAVVTDPIPMGMTLVTQTLTATLHPPPIYSEGMIHWGGCGKRRGYCPAGLRFCAHPGDPSWRSGHQHSGNCGEHPGGVYPAGCGRVVVEHLAATRPQIARGACQPISLCCNERM